VDKGDRTIKVLAITILTGAIALFFTWGVNRGVAQETEIGRYQAAVPDLVLDTCTGRLATSQGQVLEQPIDPTGEEVGRYSVDGFVTSVTRRAGLDVINQPVVWPELVKGYVVLDTQTGQVLKKRIYYRQALGPNDL